jgi:hypothetical protein
MDMLCRRGGSRKGDFLIVFVRNVRKCIRVTSAHLGLESNFRTSQIHGLCQSFDGIFVMLRCVKQYEWGGPMKHQAR